MIKSGKNTTQKITKKTAAEPPFPEGEECGKTHSMRYHSLTF